MADQRQHEQQQQQQLRHTEAAVLPLSEQRTPAKPSAKASLSCLPCVDALWFCYSPVYQMKQYYREGEFDSCTGKWADLFHCISLKTKPAAEVEAILGQRVAAQEREHIWEFRTPEEASEFWKQQFGHTSE